MSVHNSDIVSLIFNQLLHPKDMLNFRFVCKDFGDINISKEFLKTNYHKMLPRWVYLKTWPKFDYPEFLKHTCSYIGEFLGIKEYLYLLYNNDNHVLENLLVYRKVNYSRASIYTNDLIEFKEISDIFEKNNYLKEEKTKNPILVFSILFCNDKTNKILKKFNKLNFYEGTKLLDYLLQNNRLNEYSTSILRETFLLFATELPANKPIFLRNYQCPNLKILVNIDFDINFIDYIKSTFGMEIDQDIYNVSKKFNRTLVCDHLELLVMSKDILNQITLKHYITLILVLYDLGGYGYLDGHKYLNEVFSYCEAELLVLIDIGKTHNLSNIYPKKFDMMVFNLLNLKK
jgi:hypothetical protein